MYVYAKMADFEVDKMIITEAGRKSRRRRRKLKRLIAVLLFITVLIVLVILGLKLVNGLLSGSTADDDDMLLSINSATRPGNKMEHPEKIIVRRSKLVNASAQQMRNFYERADILNPYTEDRNETSPHYVIGVTGDTLMTVPTDEAVPGNAGCIVIEYTSAEDGTVPDIVVSRVNKVLAELKSQYGIINDNIISE